MAFGVRAYWSQETNNGITDRIEIQEEDYEGSAIQLEANSQGFRYRLSEITSESDDGLINPLANKIQVGKLTFFPKIVTTAEETLLDDILGSPDNTFRIVWKQDEGVNWTGYVDNKKRSYPETGGLKFSEIRASDFDILKNTTFPLDNNRQTLITTIADLFGFLDFGYNIRTATSWITEDTTDSTDFLSQIYHETQALRILAKNGDEDPQPISVWDALLKVGDPVLLFRQVNGEFTVEQLSSFSDPENVYETLYDSDGVVDTATATVDRRLSGFTSTDSGNLVVKDGSQNDIYPALKSASVTFNHRTKITGIQYPELLVLDDDNISSTKTQFLTSDGNQRIQLSAQVNAIGDDTSATEGRIQYYIKVGTSNTYYLDPSESSGWATSINLLEETLQKGTSGDEVYFNGFISQLTPKIPADADGEIEIFIDRADYLVGGSFQPLDSTNILRGSFELLNPVADQNSTSVSYRMTQSNGYSTNFTLDDSWFGDGPTDYSLSALRYGENDNQLTADSWERRGGVSYRNFHENVLKEVLDLQRSNVRKLNADFWGQYDPSKILVYDGNNYYCAGVSYVGHLGRWSANLFKIDLSTGSDTFEDILNFEPSASVNPSVTVASQLRDNKRFTDSQKITKTTSTLSGTITSIPIEAVGEQFLEPGNIFYLFNLSTASLTEFTLANPQLASDTDLTVESTALTETIVSGSWVVFTGDQIGSYRTQSDTAIRLGVRDYAQAVTPDNDAYMMTVQTDELQSGSSLSASDITDSGFTVNFSEPDFQTADVPWAFATSGDQTALDQGLSSEIAILAGEIVIKTTGNGNLAQVRLDSKASTGSLVEIKADNIDLIGVVTAINSSNDSRSEFDGGKIKADTSITVGTGDNVAILTGAHPTIRLAIGNEDPESASFRVTQAGEVYGTKFVQLSGEDVDGVIEQFSIKDLTITGTLTVGTDGKITNDNADFTTDADGFKVEAVSDGTLNPKRSYDIYDGATRVGSVYGNSVSGEGEMRISTGSGYDLNILLGSSSNNVRMATGTMILNTVTNTTKAFLDPENGSMIYNNTENRFEVYVNGGWHSMDTTSI